MDGPHSRIRYIPLLTNFTHEDKAAKGLRKRSANDEPEPPIYFTALEVVRDNKLLLLSGSASSGKTTFARYLTDGIRGQALGLGTPVVRNELGTTINEEWNTSGLVPTYYRIESLKDLRRVREKLEANDDGSERNGQKQLWILDISFHEVDGFSDALKEVTSLVKKDEHARLLILAEKDVAQQVILPADVARHDLLPLLKSQRRVALQDYIQTHPANYPGLGEAAACPALFVLALEANSQGQNAEELLDEWLLKTCSDSYARKNLEMQVFDRLQISEQPVLEEPAQWNSTVVQNLLAARHLLDLSADRAIDLFHSASKRWEPVICSLLARTKDTATARVLTSGLIEKSASCAQRGALLVARLKLPVAMEIREQIVDHMVNIIEHSTLPAMERKQAGQVLSRLGDPRDLNSLVHVPAGTFKMGANDHPNSKPSHKVSVEAFRIGKYPVVNRDYLRFVTETDRVWPSANGRKHEYQNVPATDVTWHDARAYCSWLTGWQRENGQLGPDEVIRLPTEVEWERASRGDVEGASTGGHVWPWGYEWSHDSANMEDTGFNEPCTVGIFPGNRSQYGCFDLSGNIWEWCTTLWGEDMGSPAFAYPYRDDGREAADAPDSVRRVLRGGCFSSGQAKVTCSYRGSLEPIGFWRGNGFRVVKARVA